MGLAERAIVWNRRKFGVPDAEDPNRQMRREVNAADKKHRSENEVRNNGQDAQPQVANRHDQDCPPHQGDHRGECQSSGAGYCRCTCEYFESHRFILLRLHMKLPVRMALADAGPIIGDQDRVAGV